MVLLWCDLMVNATQRSSGGRDGKADGEVDLGTCKSETATTIPRYRHAPGGRQELMLLSATHNLTNHYSICTKLNPSPQAHQNPE